MRPWLQALKGSRGCARSQWRRRYGEFSRTRLGQASLFAGLLLLAYSGILFRLLNALFILWWLAPLFILPLSSFLNKKVRRPNLPFGQP